MTDRPTGTPLANVDVQAYKFIDGKYAGIDRSRDNRIRRHLPCRGSMRALTAFLFRDLAMPVDYASEAYEGFPGLEYTTLGRDITVGPLQTVSGIDGHLGPAAHIRGRVTDKISGAPLDGISVLAYILVDGTWTPLSRTAERSAADGSYDVGGLYEGTYRIRFVDETGVYTDRYYPSSKLIEQATDVTVASGEVVTGRDCELGGSDAGVTTATVTPESVGAAASTTLPGSITVAFSDAGDGGVVTARPISPLEKGKPANFDLLGQLDDLDDRGVRRRRHDVHALRSCTHRR